MSYSEHASVFLEPDEPQDISEALWVTVLDEAGSFDVDALWQPFDRVERPQAARELYRLVTAARQRASYWLAKPFEEHGAGTNSISVLWRGKTRSWGNATSVRLRTLTGWSMYDDPVRGRDYVRYANVIDSMKDALYRIVDPTFVYVQEGRRTVRQVGERFVGLSENTDNYVNGLVIRMNAYVAREGQTPMAAQIPGFTWHPADRNHYQRGRTEKIRGGAQHYTAGTNSLAWLSTTPGTQVSATFLVKHNPTMDDRGWQLVKIEDTAWTTAFANPYTVSIEYEHKANQTIPDMAYEVLARTWAEIAWYVGERQLGNFHSGVLGHKEWVNNPSLICPDGIDVQRIEMRRREIMTAPLPAPPPSDWPKVPPAIPDPRTDNPYGKYWVPKAFAVPMASEGLASSGYVISEAFAWTNRDGEVLIVQYTERRRYELHRDGSVTLGLVGAESYLANHLERVL